ncbi:MAG: DUF4870 domain-containing protein [Candidatus Omnitrophica bacterium]|nr:DUF4870 domain-containing protein [Candidatus Omnitrophota bacterium]
MTDNKHKKERTWGMLCHLAALAGFMGIPFGHLFGPLVIWLLKKDEYPIVDEQGKESLNFQISMTIYALVAAVLIIILVGFVLLFVLAIFDLIAVIVASIKASNGEPFKYPFSIKFLK